LRDNACVVPLRAEALLAGCVSASVRKLACPLPELTIIWNANGENNTGEGFLSLYYCFSKG
ncbi:MAG TPA: hypothetical protein PK419_07455, partial [Spirochaetota bacterium]|nr:hypothetical protein [Spirochaetota bacterium]